ncbi:hemin ABC transporter ATP-binding protein, partial [Streptomyces sp. Wh19]|nr:hemin ABC transporter ATP-binding protein [Streptomyces sp. Wh19]
MRALKNPFRARGRLLPAPVAPGSPVAEARGLRVRLGQRPVLDSIGLTARAGEVLA